jgi:hypothetical protein
MNEENIDPEARGSWTFAIRRYLLQALPPEHLLPERQPAFVRSWTYVLSAITLASLVWVVISGAVCAFFGPQWWHVSPQGRFFNSLHFWSTQVFFVFMVLHLWAQFFGAGWRDGRALTWITGVLLFVLSIGTAFTGYLSQENFDSQWIGVNAKDAMNAVGIGAFFNVLNFGQMYGLHVLLLPAGLLLFVAVHILLVRMRGVVRPLSEETR